MVLSMLSYLVEKHILAITAFVGELFQISILTDAMFETKLLPELCANWGTISAIQVHYRVGEGMWWSLQGQFRGVRKRVGWDCVAGAIPLLPHWPA